MVVVFVPAGIVVLLGPTLWSLLALIGVGVLWGVYRRYQALAVDELMAEQTRLDSKVQHYMQLDRAKQEMIAALEKADILRAAVRVAQNAAEADAAAIFLFDQYRKQLTLSMAQGGSTTAFEAWSTLAANPEHARDDARVIRAGARADVYPELVSSYRSLLELPIRANNAVLGYLRLYYATPTPQASARAELLTPFTRFAGQVIDNLDLFSIMESYANDMAQLAHLARVASSADSHSDALNRMTLVLRGMVDASAVTLAVVNPRPGSKPLLEFYGDGVRIEPLMLDSIAEFAELRMQTRPRARQYDASMPDLSPGMRDLLQLYGGMLTVFPLISYVELLGFILIGGAALSDRSDDRWQLLEMASAEVASQVLNARVQALSQQSLAARLEELNVLALIAQQITSALDPDTILATMVEMAVKATNANLGTVAVAQEDDDTWKIIQYNDNGVLQRSTLSRQGDTGIIAEVARSREPMVVRDTREMSYRFKTANPSSYLSSIGVPLISEGSIIGVLQLESLRPEYFSDEQSSFLSNLARHAVVSIENARLLEDRQHQISTLRHIQGLSLRLSSVTETGHVAREVILTALELMHGRRGALFRIRMDDQRKLELLAEVSESSDGVRPSELFKSGTIVLRAAQTGEIQLVQDSHSVMGGEVVRFYAIVVPIKRGERTREVLCVAFDRQPSFSQRELSSVGLLATQAAGHLENTALHEYIRSRNDRMRAILNSTRDGVILLDKQGRLVETNPAVRRLLGVDLEEHLGENFVDLLMRLANDEPSDGAGYTPDELRVLARQLRLEPQLISRRQFSRAALGKMLYIEEIGSPVMGSDGGISGRLLVLRDVTQQRELDDYREKITDMAVHDLRGPLASIISGLQFVLDEPDAVPDAMVRKTLGLSLDSAQNLLRLAESLLDISRLEKREMPLKRTPTRLETLIGQAERALENTTKSARITITRNFAPDLPPLDVDPDIVRRVLVNLLDNALRFSPNDSIILVEALECPNCLEVRIADSGPGIPAEERGAVFERFRQLKGTLPLRGSRGSGLGLTFCKLAVEAHGGRIWIEQQGPLPGACIALTLPTGTD